MIKLFAHRGFAKGGILQNSIASLKEAKKNGFKAIEFDIWFLRGQLFLKHDLPQENELENLAKFCDYLLFGNELSYWLDFKNLDEKNATEALELVKKEIDEALINLDQIYFAPFVTDYKIAGKIFIKIKEIFGDKINLVAVCEETKSENDVKILHDFLTRNGVKFLSIFHQLVDKKFVEDFNGIEVFAWTVNDLNRLQELENIGVKNFATDKITPK